jgi:hypothetical protein
MVVDVRQGAGPIGTRLRLGNGRGKGDRERVLALAQQMPYVPAKGAMHVLAAGDLGAVEFDDRHRVEAEGDEIVPL